MDIRGKTIQEGEPIPDYPCEIKNEINIAGAIQILNKLKSKVNLVKADEKEYRLPYLISIEKQAIDTVLSELEKKDKIIDLMAEQLAGLAIFDIDKDESLILGDKEEIKEYFTKKVEKEGIKE